MVQFILNGQITNFDGDPKITLLKFLWNIKNITSVKDGCSCQGSCGACMVEINGEAKLSCLTPLKKLENAKVNTLEGLPEDVRDIMAKAFVEKGAVQCGFCTPGFIMTAVEVLETGKEYTRDELRKLLSGHLCRCTGYENILNAVEKTMKKRLGKA